MSTKSPASSRFEFDAPTHTYRLDGRRLVGVTDVLKAVGMIDDAWYTEEGRERGRNVHIACQFMDEGELDWPDFEARFPSLVGYVMGYRKFRTETGFTPTLVEQPLFHPTLKYAGTPDRFGRAGEELWLPDLKTGRPEPWAGIQTAAYEKLIRVSPGVAYRPLDVRPIKRLAVELLEVGDYRVHWFSETHDWPVFQSAYNVANWIAQKQNGGRYGS